MTIYNFNPASTGASSGSSSSPAPTIVTGNTTTRPANTTAYAAYQLLANSTTAGSVTPATIAAAKGTNLTTTAVRCRLQKSGVAASGAGSVANAYFRIHFYNVLPTVTNGDGAAWLSTLAGWVGAFDITQMFLGSDYSAGIGTPVQGSTMAFSPVSGTSNLYYLIEAMAAYTPGSAEVFTPTLELL